MSDCQHCGESNALKRAAQRLLRCGACHFIFSLSRSREQREPAISNWKGPAPVNLGSVLRDRYRLVDFIGEGAHGLTYLADHEFLNHPCVVKILPHQVTDASDAAVRRLRNEARAGFRVNHPNVVRVLDCDTLEGMWYFVMEYVDGVNLAELLQSGLRVGWQQATEIALDVANGLAAIHRAGLLHRDIKPGNLMLAIDSHIRVADLGVVGLTEGETSLTEPHWTERAGTLEYAAPEVFLTDTPVDGRSDLYSLGATLFHLMNGRAPHANTSVFTQLLNVQNRSVEWPVETEGETPPWLRQAILRLLETDPNQRFSAPEAFIEYLTHPSRQQTSIETPKPNNDVLRPGGIAILPFQNESDQAADNWLGHAVADYLIRSLSQMSGIYVADQNQLLAFLENRPLNDLFLSPEAVLEAGRLVGAGTIVEGRFRRQDDIVRFSAFAYHAGQSSPMPLAQAEGPLSKLVDLQAALLEELLRIVKPATTEGEPARPPAPPSITLAAQEQFTLGKQAYLRGDYATAIQLAEQALERDAEFIEPIGFIGVCHARLGRYDAALEQHRKQEALAARRGDQRALVEAQANMGVTYYFKGEHPTALEFYNRAAALAEQLGLITELGQIHNNRGFVLFRLERPADAEQAFSRAIEIHKTYGALASLVGPYNGIGNVLVEQQRYEEAQEFYRRALTLAQEIGDRTKVGFSHMHLGRCASLRGRFGEAKNEFTMALNALEETSFWNGLTRLYEYMAEMNLRLGNLQEAIRCADKRIELARLHANRTMEEAAWRQKAEALRLAGRNEEAQACFQQIGAPVSPLSSPSR